MFDRRTSDGTSDGASESEASQTDMNAPFDDLYFLSEIPDLWASVGREQPPIEQDTFEGVQHDLTSSYLLACEAPDQCVEVLTPILLSFKELFAECCSDIGLSDLYAPSDSFLAGEEEVLRVLPSTRPTTADRGFLCSYLGLSSASGSCLLQRRCSDGYSRVDQNPGGRRLRYSTSQQRWQTAATRRSRTRAFN